MRDATHSLEIWASPEATFARTGPTTVRDQLAETGHGERDGDLDMLAGLGVRAARYPVLWERTAPASPTELDLDWARERLNGLHARGVEPVVTLMHHGSGPTYTDLTDPDFPTLFATYAGRVAREFPWVRRWTPINEITTTARFSTLYGAWYPNGVWDHAAFGRAMLNQCRATLLAMAAIRQHVREAELVVTEDLQRFVSHDPVAERYCRHKRERSFLAIDLIYGRVDEDHALWDYLTRTCGIRADDLRGLRDEAVTPALLGFNYYTNSERFVRSRSDGGFDNVPLVDVAGPQIDPKPLLRSAHDRYRLPFGFTEIHLCGEAHERTGWFVERVHDAAALAREGLPCVVAGAWAAFGLVDWRSLLTRREAAVEHGVFTYAGARGKPKPTAVAEAVRTAARGLLPAGAAPEYWWHSQWRRRKVDDAGGLLEVAV